jgi:hypothetical protein
MPWNKYTPGAENKRLEQVNNYCPVYVMIIDLMHQDEIVYQTELDYANYADRKRLGRLTFWAVQNGHSVETMNKLDAEPPIQRGNEQ